MQALQSLAFPMQGIVSRNANTFLAFLGEYDKPVVQELAPWLKGLT
jgi:hypothetical protein